MQGHHYQCQIAGKCRLIDQNEGFCGTGGTDNALIHRFKSLFLSVCLEWIVIH